MLLSHMLISSLTRVMIGFPLVASDAHSNDHPERVAKDGIHVG
jgi:hypothetical protein